MSGIVILLVGLVLCFLGVRSVHLAVLASGFALGWLVTEPFDASLGVSLVVALAAAAVAWVLATFVFRAALFFVGAIAGGVIGAKLFGLLQGGSGNIVLVVIFVLAVGFVSGLATQRFHTGVLAGICALGGAGLVLSGVALAFPDSLGFLRTPDTTGQAALAGVLWLALALAGWAVQRRTAGERARR